ncbi:MAG TPA: hypothetical protein V6C88_01120 [Chroococcidiopsis sp.]
MLPTIVHEHAVRRFYFYNDGTMYEGMSYQNRLYKLVDTFSMADKSYAYQLGCKLSYAGSQTVITATPYQHRVWTDLQTPIDLDSLSASSRNQATTASSSAL